MNFINRYIFLLITAMNNAITVSAMANVIEAALILDIA